MTLQNNLSIRLSKIQQQLDKTNQNNGSLFAVANEFCELGEDAAKTSQDTVRRGAELLGLVSELAGNWNSTEQADYSLNQLIEFLGDGIAVLNQAIETGDGEENVDALVDVAKENWPDYLETLGGIQISNRSFNGDSWGDDDHIEEELTTPDSDQIAMMLSALSGDAPLADQHVDSQSYVKEAQETSNTLKRVTQTLAVDAEVGAEFISSPNRGSDEKAASKLIADPEMLEAYLDDASRCVASMEQAAMAIEEDSSDRESVRQFCRELHTLKGASATVGLSELATYLHESESNLEGLFTNEQDEVDAERLFLAVDQVRALIEELQPTKIENLTIDDSASTPRKTTKQFSNELSNFAGNDDASIRIRASQLDRLMDMLAELVVLRNRQESDVHEFDELNEELRQCSTRISVADDVAQLQRAMLENDELMDLEMLQNSQSSAVMSEVSKDISAVSRGLRDLQKPIIQNNISISRFIRDFRQELMQLRRIPMMGLFSRLQRAARDAAKSEGKQIRIQLTGQNVGLEQEIQERLFESLLHVVRNSVSHGIEDKSKRLKFGKDAVGVIKLAASSNAQLLIIDVHDDGAGIDYNAIRRRATEKGLLLPGQEVSEAQLGKLIFHPGFSTKRTATSVSGRGVGMDIVATTIEQLKGRIEVDSVHGQGTHVRILIPLKSGIEHVMVFRAGEQLFGLPMQAISSAKRADGDNAVSVVNVFGLDSSIASGTGDVLHVRRANTAGNNNVGANNLALQVDELIGPEEVVVRKLPNLLLRHPLFSGVTLSGSGKKVLLLNAEQFVTHCKQTVEPDDRSLNLLTPRGTVTDQKRALVVDDSLTARRALSKAMQARGYLVVEAGDGVRAIEILRKQPFDIILTDLDMPKMGGLELLLDIESGSYSTATKVVVSSRNEKTFREQATEAGAVDYLTKPITAESVERMLDNLPLTETKKGNKNDE